MAIFTQTVSAADILSGLTTDDTKWAGANIANCDYVLTTLWTELQTDMIFKGSETFTGGTGVKSFDLKTAVASIQTVGKWYLKAQWTTNNTDNSEATYYFLFEDNNNYVRMMFRDSGAGSSDLEMKEAGGLSTLISGTSMNGTTEHYLETIRDGLGNYELLTDGVSEGTATDDFLPAITKEFFEFGNAGTSTIDIKEMKESRLLLYV